MEREVSTIADEDERQRQLAELAEDGGPDWMAAYAPGSFGCHELLDRTNLVGDMLEQQVMSHPACVANPEWYAQAAMAVTIVRDLYQQIGTNHAGNENPIEEEKTAVGPRS